MTFLGQTSTFDFRPRHALGHSTPYKPKDGETYDTHTPTPNRPVQGALKSLDVSICFLSSSDLGGVFRLPKQRGNSLAPRNPYHPLLSIVIQQSWCGHDWLPPRVRSFHSCPEPRWLHHDREGVGQSRRNPHIPPNALLFAHRCSG